MSGRRLFSHVNHLLWWYTLEQSVSERKKKVFVTIRERNLHGASRYKRVKYLSGEDGLSNMTIIFRVWCTTHHKVTVSFRGEEKDRTKQTVLSFSENALELSRGKKQVMFELKAPIVYHPCHTNRATSPYWVKQWKKSYCFFFSFFL